MLFTGKGTLTMKKFSTSAECEECSVMRPQENMTFYDANKFCGVWNSV
jgi:hypothetical protein